jgi:hypothetical protein
MVDQIFTRYKCQDQIIILTKKMASCFRTLTKGMGYDQIRDVAPCTRKKYWRIACADRVNLSWCIQLLHGGTVVEAQIDKKCHKLENLIYPGNTQKHMKI